MVTAVILMTGSVLVILENITKLFHPQPVNDEGILWLGIIAVSINVLASLVIRKGQTKNESILSLHFLEDTLGWLAVILMAIVLRFTDWYILDPLLSLAISIFILSKAIPRFWSTLRIFLDAVPEGVDIQQVKSDLEQLDHVASINQLNLWTMDGLEKNAIVHVCLEHVNHMEVCKESIRTLLKDCGFQNVTIEYCGCTGLIQESSPPTPICAASTRRNMCFGAEERRCRRVCHNAFERGDCRRSWSMECFS